MSAVTEPYFIDEDLDRDDPLSAQVYEAMQLRGIATMTDLAARAGISSSTMSNLLNNPDSKRGTTLHTLNKIAEALDCHWDHTLKVNRRERLQ